MKKTLIALIALAGVTLGEETNETKSYTLKMANWTTPDSTDWTTADSAPYDYLYDAFNVGNGGTVSFTLNVNYTGTNCNHYQTLIHIGKGQTGMSIMANGGPRIIVGEQHDPDDANNNHELSNVDAFKPGNNTVTVDIIGDGKGTAAVSITLGDKVYSEANGTQYVADLKWSEMEWDSISNQRTKYSINFVAPGWGKDTTEGWGANKYAETTTLISGVVTFTAAPIPEPTTATLSLLALAGLAARRRRK